MMKIIQKWGHHIAKRKNELRLAHSLLSKASTRTLAILGYGDSHANYSNSQSNIPDCRVLMKNLVMGLKNIVWGIGSCTQAMRARQSAAGVSSGADPHRAFIAEECLIFTRLLKNGLKCFSIYSEGPNPSLQEEKDVRSANMQILTFL